MITRRQVLANFFAGATSVVASRLAFATAPTESRFVFVLLRGALDGLGAVAPVGDPDYARLRGQLALATRGEGAALPLDGAGDFALHPALRFLHAAYGSGELAIVHAVASPYRERSHFDAQDMLESGFSRPQASTTGWINRAIAALPAGQSRDGGVALGATVPLAMRGPAEVASWSPTNVATLEESTLARVADLYAKDPLLSQRLADALQSDSIATAAREAAAVDTEVATMNGTDVMSADATVRRNLQGRLVETARAAGNFLRQEEGPRVAMFDTTGWDTHANQGGAQGQLALRLAGLDAALAALKESLGPVWRRAAVLVATEFGRTAAINGTRGTDHGTGAAAFLLGGAVRGGRVIADWPGLSTAKLLDGRDLMPTLDLRSLAKGVLHDHLGVPSAALERDVFPDSAAARPMPGLVA